MTLEEISARYLRTGELDPKFYKYQFDYIMENVQYIYEEYLDNYELDNRKFVVHMLERVHDWQIDNGFGREIIDDLVDKILENMDSEEDNDEKTIN